MPKKLWIGLLIVLVILPAAVFAGSFEDMSTQSLFQVDTFDQSKEFLGRIFGTVGTVLKGTSGQLLGQLFRIFNMGILVIAGIFFVWTTIQTVVNTAHEGQFMGGSNKKPAFTILRTVAGFGLLVPSFATGYSMIQVGVMWVILQGVGFANTAWNTALDYLEDGGVVYAPQRQSAAELVDMVGTIMAAQVCMYYHEQKAKSAPGADTRFIPNFRPTVSEDNVKFPKDPGNSPGDAGCGGFRWNMGDKNDYVQAAMQQVIIDTQTVARRIVDPRGLSSRDICRLVLDAVLGGAASWSNILLPARRIGNMDGYTKMFFDQARRDGWLYAGSYYFRLSGLQAQFKKASDVKFGTSNTIEGLVMCAGDTCDYLRFTKSGGAECSGTGGNIAVKTDDTKLRLIYQQLSSFVADASNSAQKIDAEATNMPRIQPPDLGILSPLMSPVMNGVTNATGSLGSGADPILSLKNAGETMVGVVAAFMVVATVLMFVLSVVASIMSSVQPVGYAIRDAFQTLMVSISPLMIMILTQGITMATYVPIIPWIIYTFAVMGWFIIVIETLVAAPLVALGLTHPEGHDTLGRAEPAVLLLLNVFLRPILMVFGLFAGMILSKIGLEILGTGLMTVLASMGGMNVFLLLGLLFVYIALVIQMITLCYGLITAIPDKVIRWIGGQAEQTGGVQEALGAAKSGAETAAKGIGDSMGKAYEMGASEGDKMDSHKSTVDADDARKEKQANKNKQPTSSGSSSKNKKSSSSSSGKSSSGGSSGSSSSGDSAGGGLQAEAGDSQEGADAMGEEGDGQEDSGADSGVGGANEDSGDKGGKKNPFVSKGNYKPNWSIIKKK